jgi:hypothetical protein
VAGSVIDGVSAARSHRAERRCNGTFRERVGFWLVALAAGAGIVGHPARLAAQDTLPPARPPDSANVHVLDSLDVEVSSTISATKQKMKGFEERRHTGRGVYITREQIEGRAAVQLSDLLTNISGVTVERDDYGNHVYVWIGRGYFRCEPILFIDGSPRGVVNINDYRPGQVEAIEVYTRASAAPPGYRMGRCGSLIIWTRETLSERPEP